MTDQTLLNGIFNVISKNEVGDISSTTNAKVIQTANSLTAPSGIGTSGWTLGWNQADFKGDPPSAQTMLTDALVASGSFSTQTAQAIGQALSNAGTSQSVNFSGIGPGITLASINAALQTAAAKQSTLADSQADVSSHYSALTSLINSDANIDQELKDALSDPTYGALLSAVIADYDNQFKLQSGQPLMQFLENGTYTSTKTGIETDLDTTDGPAGYIQSIMNFTLNSKYVDNSGGGFDIARRVANDITIANQINAADGNPTITNNFSITSDEGTAQFTTTNNGVTYQGTFKYQDTSNQTQTGGLSGVVFQTSGTGANSEAIDVNNAAALNITAANGILIEGNGNNISGLEYSDISIEGTNDTFTGANYSLILAASNLNTTDNASNLTVTDASGVVNGNIYLDANGINFTDDATGSLGVLYASGVTSGSATLGANNLTLWSGASGLTVGAASGVTSGTLVLAYSNLNTTDDASNLIVTNASGQSGGNLFFGANNESFTDDVTGGFGVAYASGVSSGTVTLGLNGQSVFAYVSGLTIGDGSGVTNGTLILAASALNTIDDATNLTVTNASGQSGGNLFFGANNESFTDDVTGGFGVAYASGVSSGTVTLGLNGQSLASYVSGLTVGDASGVTGGTLFLAASNINTAISSSGITVADASGVSGGNILLNGNNLNVTDDAGAIGIFDNSGYSGGAVTMGAGGESLVDFANGLTVGLAGGVGSGTINLETNNLALTVDSGLTVSTASGITGGDVTFNDGSGWAVYYSTGGTANLDAGATASIVGNASVNLEAGASATLFNSTTDNVTLNGASLNVAPGSAVNIDANSSIINMYGGATVNGDGGSGDTFQVDVNGSGSASLSNVTSSAIVFLGCVTSGTFSNDSNDTFNIGQPGQGTSGTFYGDSGDTFNLGYGDVITFSGSESVFNVYMNDSITSIGGADVFKVSAPYGYHEDDNIVCGTTGNKIYIDSGALSVDVTASGSDVYAGSAAGFDVTGTGDVVYGDNNDTVIVDGSSDQVFADSSYIDFNSGSSGDIVSGSGDTGYGWDGSNDDPGAGYDGGYYGYGFAAGKGPQGSNITGIAAYEAAHGNAAGAVAAEAARLQAEDAAAASTAAGLSSAVFEGPTWARKTISWTLDVSTGSGSSFTGALSSQLAAEIQQAFQAWAKASGLNFYQTPSAKADIKIGLGSFDSPDTGILGFSKVGAQNGVADNAAIILEDPSEDALVSDANGQLAYGQSGTEFEQLVMHEIGHILGLADSSDPNSIMAPTMGSTNTTLDATDIDAIQSLYGASSSSSASSSTASYWSNLKAESAQLIDAMAGFTGTGSSALSTQPLGEAGIAPIQLAAVH